MKKFEMILVLVVVVVSCCVVSQNDVDAQEVIYIQSANCATPPGGGGSFSANCASPPGGGSFSANCNVSPPGGGSFLVPQQGPPAPVVRYYSPPVVYRRQIVYQALPRVVYYGPQWIVPRQSSFGFGFGFVRRDSVAPRFSRRAGFYND